MSTGSQFSRRAFAQGLGAIATTGLVAGCRDKDPAETGDTGVAPPEPAPDRDPEPEPWDPGLTEDAVAFPWGVVVGDPMASTAEAGGRTAETEALTLVLAVAEGAGWIEAARVEGVEITDTAFQTQLSGLAADTAYSLYFLCADGARRSPVARFRTAPDASTPLRKIVIGATSCFGGNWPFPCMQHAADADLDLFLLLGDTVYADGAATLDEYRAFYEVNLSSPTMLALFGSVGVVATWDDHEVDNNWVWEDVSQEKFEAARAAYWEALPQGRGEGGTGIWRLIPWGPSLDLIVLDSRGERKDGNYLSLEQMAWLKASLSASTARFKLILNSTPITDMTNWYGDAFVTDRWQGYAQRDEILSYIQENGIEGVLWVSGDHHLGMVNRVDPPGDFGSDQWEVLTGPTGSRINVLGDLLVLDEQFQMAVLAWNWTRFELDPNLGTVGVQFIGDDGALLAETTLQL